MRRAVVAYNGGDSLDLILLLCAVGGEVTSPSGTAPDRYVYYPAPKSTQRGPIEGREEDE